jgi:hypothetical protein
MFFSDGGANTACDPAVAIGPAGETYFEALSLSNSGIYVGRSNDGGVTVPSWVQLTQATVNYSDDKPQMVVDTTTGSLSGAVYVTWTRFRANGAFPIMMSASFDGGGTWSAAQRLSDSPYCQGSCPAVGPNGELTSPSRLQRRDDQVRPVADGGVTWARTSRSTTRRTRKRPTPLSHELLPGRRCRPQRRPLPRPHLRRLGHRQRHASGPDVFLPKSTDGGATFRRRSSRATLTPTFSSTR